MDYSSDSSLEISDSDIADRAETSYKRLRSGDAKVKSSNGTYRCPFCAGKKKQDYQLKDLIQHATGIGASSNRKAKTKADHQGLSRFLKSHVKCETNTGSSRESKQPVPVIVEKESKKKEDERERYVWPWMGILANLPTEKIDGRYVGESGTRMKEKLSEFKPLKVIPIWNARGHTGRAVVEFGNDWPGFEHAMAFEKYFTARRCGKRDWAVGRELGVRLYGWVAREDDYCNGDQVANHLRNNGDLKSVGEIAKDENRKQEKLLKNLEHTLEVKSNSLHEMECKFNETNLSLEKTVKEKDELLQKYNDEMKHLQHIAREHTRRVIEENLNLKSDLDSKRKELDRRCRQLDKLVAQSDYDRKRLAEEKERNMRRNTSLDKAVVEQKKADEKVLKLVEEQKKEKEIALQKLIELEKQLDAKQQLELEIEKLRGQVQVMMHMGAEEDTDIQKKVDEMNTELNEKMEEMEVLESMNQTLIVKERRTNDELQDARKVLIEALKDSVRSIIGVKRMGEVDQKAFLAACKERFPEDFEIKGVKLCSKWQEQLKDSSWHPFRVISVDGTHKEVLEDDENLTCLRNELGEDAYKAVIMALQEMNEYNPSGRYTIPELWNFKEKRKATMKEAIEHLVKQLKTYKRKR